MYIELSITTIASSNLRSTATLKQIRVTVEHVQKTSTTILIFLAANLQCNQFNKNNIFNLIAASFELLLSIIGKVNIFSSSSNLIGQYYISHIFTAN